MKQPSLLFAISILGAVLSLPLLADMSFGLTAAATPLSGVIMICWIASLVIGIVATTIAWREKAGFGRALMCASVPVVVFALGWLPLWPLVGR